LDYTSVQGAEMVGEALRQISDGSEQPIAQDEAQATYCKVIKKEDGKIDWSKPALEIHRHIRGYLPWPTGYTYWNGLKLTVFQASVIEGEQTNHQPGTVLGVDKKSGILIQTGNGLLALQQLQLQSKKPMDYKNFMNGVRDFTGSVLGG
jgi:methionyl-tRNA formyltransferase